VTRWQLSVRARLTLWHATVLALIVCLFCAGILLFLRARLFSELDAQLGRELAIIDRVYREEPVELGDLPGDRGFLFFQIVEGSRVRHETDAWRQIGLSSAQADPASRAARDGTWFRVQAHAGPNYRISAAVDESPVRHTLWLLGVVLLAGVPFAVALAVAGGYFLAGRVLRPVGAMAEKARQITAESLTERLPVTNAQDEFGRLAAVFNDLLTRLHDSFERQRRFTADASHELRTPLTTMRSVGEVTLQGARDPAAYRDAIGSMLEEVDRLASLVESLLTLTRADSGAIRLAREPVRLDELTAAVADQLRVLAEEKKQTMELDAREALRVNADPAVLRLALANLIHNAIKYTPSGGSIRITVKSPTRATVLVEIRDSGPGIAAAHREKVFERFYRVDSARSRDAGGVGLGLAIARWAIEVNGGSIELESEEGKGALFRVVLAATL
jgi:heavy metal sensor kinase